MIGEWRGKLQVEEDTSQSWIISTNHYKKKKNPQPNRRMMKSLKRYAKTEYPNGQLISAKVLNLIYH